MIDKRCDDMHDALAGIADGATILISGFGEAGNPTELIHALIDQGARELTVVNNNAGNGDVGLARLIQQRRVRKLICSYPRSPMGYVFDDLYRAGEIDPESIVTPSIFVQTVVCVPNPISERDYLRQLERERA